MASCTAMLALTVSRFVAGGVQGERPAKRARRGGPDATQATSPVQGSGEGVGSRKFLLKVNHGRTIPATASLAMRDGHLVVDIDTDYGTLHIYHGTWFGPERKDGEVHGRGLDEWSVGDDGRDLEIDRHYFRPEDLLETPPPNYEELVTMYGKPSYERIPLYRGDGGLGTTIDDALELGLAGLLPRTLQRRRRRAWDYDR